MKAKLRARYKTLEDAYTVLSPKEVYDANEGGRYPSRALVRRVWDYGEPGTDVLPDAGGQDHDGWKALRGLLAAELSVAFVTSTGKAVRYEEYPPPEADRFVFAVDVDDEHYLLGVGRGGSVARTADHPIVFIHPDVVEEILEREAKRWAVR